MLNKMLPRRGPSLAEFANWHRHRASMQLREFPNLQGLIEASEKFMHVFTLFMIHAKIGHYARHMVIDAIGLQPVFFVVGRLEQVNVTWVHIQRSNKEPPEGIYGELEKQ